MLQTSPAETCSGPILRARAASASQAGSRGTRGTRGTVPPARGQHLLAELQQGWGRHEAGDDEVHLLLGAEHGRRWRLPRLCDVRNSKVSLKPCIAPPLKCLSKVALRPSWASWGPTSAFPHSICWRLTVPDALILSALPERLTLGDSISLSTLPDAPSNLLVADRATSPLAVWGRLSASGSLLVQRGRAGAPAGRARSRGKPGASREPRQQAAPAQPPGPMDIDLGTAAAALGGLPTALGFPPFEPSFARCQRSEAGCTDAAAQSAVFEKPTNRCALARPHPRG